MSIHVDERDQSIARYETYKYNFNVNSDLPDNGCMTRSKTKELQEALIWS